jgi:hypothetical protein
MEQQKINCKIGHKLEGVITPFGAETHASKFRELGEMVVQRVMADVVQRREGDEIRNQAHEWMGQSENSVGSLAYWLRPSPTEDALAVLDDDERRVLSAALDPKFFQVTKEYCSRERFRIEEMKVLRKLRTLN